MNDHDRFGGHPPRGFRSWDTSGFHLGALCDLIEGIGGPVWATGPTGAALFGCDGYELRPPFHLLVERGRNVTRVGHVIHTTRDIPLLDQTRVGPVPVTSATRTLMILAGLDTPARVTAALDSALRDGLTSEDFLHRRIVDLRRSGRNGISAILHVLEGGEITRGGHSWLEREFLRMVHAAGLPRPETQRVLGRRGDTLIRVDVRFPGTNLVVELMGYRFHRTKHQTMVDAQRWNRLQMDGFRVLGFTYDEVVSDPATVIATVREALATSVLVTTRR